LSALHGDVSFLLTCVRTLFRFQVSGELGTRIDAAFSEKAIFGSHPDGRHGPVVPAASNAKMKQARKPRAGKFIAGFLSLDLRCHKSSREMSCCSGRNTVVPKLT
jgi:hypothetical protein